MLTITVPEDIEKSLRRRATAIGTTAELLAIDELRSLHGTADQIVPDKEGTMADFMAGYIGVIDSSEYVPGGANMSQVTGQQIAEAMYEDHIRQASGTAVNAPLVSE